MSQTITFSGIGNSLVVNEKCNSNKIFTSSYTTEFSNDDFLLILNYQNSFIGKRLLSTVFNGNEVVTGSDGLLNFRVQYYFDSETNISYIIVFINGIYKKCNYSSYEVDFLVPSATNKALHDNLKSKAKGADELHKLLESNPSLNKLFLKLKEKYNI